MVSGSAAAGPHRATILDCQELRSRSLVAAAAPLLRATRRRRLPAIGLARASSCSTSAWGNQLELLDWFWAYSVSSLTYMSAGSRLAHLDGTLEGAGGGQMRSARARADRLGGVNISFLRCE